MRPLALLALACCLSAASPDLSERDKQVHFLGGAFISYATSDILSKTTSLGPFPRWLLSNLTTTAVGWAYEELVGYYDPKDAHAVSAGGLVGSTAFEGVSFLLTPNSVGLTLSLKIP